MNPQTVPDTQELLSNCLRKSKRKQEDECTEPVGTRPLEGMEQMTLVGAEGWCWNSTRSQVINQTDKTFGDKGGNLNMD